MRKVIITDRALTADEQWKNLCKEIDLSMRGESRIFGSAFKNISANNWGKYNYVPSAFYLENFRKLYNASKTMSWKDYKTRHGSYPYDVENLFLPTNFVSINRTRINRGIQKHYPLLCEEIKNNIIEHCKKLKEYDLEKRQRRANKINFKCYDSLVVMINGELLNCVISKTNIQDKTHKIYFPSTFNEKTQTCETIIVKNSNLMYSQKQLNSDWNEIRKKMHSTDFYSFDGAWNKIIYEKGKELEIYKILYGLIMNNTYDEAKQIINSHPRKNELISLFNKKTKHFRFYEKNKRNIKRKLGIYGKCIYYDLTHEIEEVNSIIEPKTSSTP